MIQGKQIRTSIGFYILRLLLVLCFFVGISAVVRADPKAVKADARDTIVLGLTRTSLDKKAGVQIFKNNTWKAVPGTWLSVDHGSWDQQPGGISLNKTGEHGGNVADLQGLNFYLSDVGSVGTANYPDLGDSGKWEVVATAPLKAKTKIP